MSPMNIRNLAALAAVMAMGVSSERQPEPPRKLPPTKLPYPGDDLVAKYRQERLKRKRANYAKRAKS